MYFQITGSIAEFEHALISELTRDGLRVSRPNPRWKVRHFTPFHLPIPCPPSLAPGPSPARL
jgi:DNA invertase Pin-like site-specific DNA recombinase